MVADQNVAGDCDGIGADGSGVDIGSADAVDALVHESHSTPGTT